MIYIKVPAITDIKALPNDRIAISGFPVVPNRLSYPEWFADEYLYQESASDMALSIESRFTSGGYCSGHRLINMGILKR